ncbi:hypothetical protein EDB19DRAFT_1858711 [Suillus lakei]|nr:hypothetical protein EDB19DRAFT_1858711 [Suillus lakei]
MQRQTVDFPLLSDVIDALQNILARSQVIMPDLETPYSRAKFSPANHSAIELKDHSIGAIITERQQQLDAVLYKVSGLETVMDSINNIYRYLIEKDKITQSTNLHKKLVLALWRLPTEVISQKFVHCLPKHHTWWPSSKLAPMLLTRICRRWREVAVRLPILWCRLRLDAEGVHDRQWQLIAFCYDSWLRRSRGLPLSLEVWCYADNSTTKLRSLIQPYSALHQSNLVFFYPFLPRRRQT